jgi:hypothetical protein
VAGVQIAVDGVPAGTVEQGNLALVSTNPGVRRVSAAKAGFLPASMVVTVTPGERRRLVFEMAPVVLASASVTSTSLSTGEPTMLASRVAPAPPRVGLWASVASAATLAAATGVFALLTRNAHDEFDRQLMRVPNDRRTIDDARSRMSRYAVIADVVGAAAVVATGVSIYMAVSDPGPQEPRLATAGWRGKF